ncbi:MAG: hypothetical protein JJU36_16535 [Phycisphaeraceae bacterium]|nr:hypothetical protein [Phycisphaeraceae bacterium]
MAGAESNGHPESGLGDKSIRALTWAALLGRWIELARSSLALPDDEEGRAMKASVPDIIMLQAVWMALGELDRLAEDERQLGIDQAAVLIQRHTQAIGDRFGDAIPAALLEVIEDARDRLRHVRGDEPD